MTDGQQDRVGSIDLMRAIAIIGMVVCHTMSFLSYEEQGYPLLSFVGQQVFGDFPASIFIFASGLSLALTLEGCLDSSVIQQWQQSNRKRGALIFCLGLLFSVLVWGPQQIFLWGILTMTGSSIFFLTYLIHFPLWSLILIAGGVLLGAPFIREHTHFIEYWGGNFQNVTPVLGRFSGIFVEPVREFISDFTLSSVISGFFSNGEFPFLPWSAFSILGFVVGRLRLQWKTWIGFSIGVFSIVFGFGIALSAFYSEYNSELLATQILAPFSFYPDSLSLFLVQLGVCFILLTSLHSIFDQSDGRSAIDGWRRKVLRVGTQMSRYTLSTFFLHHILLLWPIWIGGFLQGHLYFYYGRVCTPPFGFLLALLLLLMCYFLSVFIDRYARAWSLESMIRKLSSRI